jgi:DNA-binding beta-propeller fold protein YncE
MASRSLLFAGLISLTFTARLFADPKDDLKFPENQKAAPAAATDRPLRLLPGMQSGGQIVLPTQWSLEPAGRQIKLGDFPVNIALHPKESWAAVLHAGYGEHEVAIVDLDNQRVVSRVTLPQAFYGLCFDPAGARLFVSGGEWEVAHQFAFKDGYLSEHRELKLGDPKDTFVPAGMVTSPDGKNLYVACPWGGSLAVLNIDPASTDPSRPAVRHIPLAKHSFPYTALQSPDGKRLYVSLWGAAAIAVLNPANGEILAQWPTESHPTEMAVSPGGELLYVACANSNQVSVLDTSSGASLEVISSALYPQAARGSTPNSLALSPDGAVLLIANADNNNLAVVNVVERGHSRSLGFIPVGWYPTSVRHDARGRIYVANGKGLMSTSNRNGPNPLKDPPASVREYIGGLFRGTLSVIEPLTPAAQARYTEQAFRCSPLKPDATARASDRSADNPIPARVGGPSPIKHCIYIIKENRTYDQVFGDIREGNGDPSLCIFPERVTPNHHALVRQFVLLDNFYVESEVSADGHEWSMAAYATDFVEKTWPLNYRHGNRDKIAYPSEGSRAIAMPASGYIWDRCRQAGLSYFSFGEFIKNGAKPGDPGKAAVKGLEGHFDPLFRSYDLDYPDVKRAARFASELKRFEQAGELPRFIVMRLPNDHTYGTRIGKPTPTAMVAENDVALGQVVEAISHSKFWHDTAIFVVEDDAQNGSDHIDAHRTVALVISPYTRHGQVDSNMYSTSSMLRTMELILGLEPMTQFDAAALPMYGSFQAKPDTAVYQHRPAQVQTAAVNRPGAWGAELSEKFDLSREDAADDLQLNEVVWRSVRGPDSRMPPPVRASFVFVRPKAADDDD